ncbi:RagB/SusD family nutrient uptake outer membrane protein [Aggregatimonas sangjinii]|uniref:RagB/SusD family nutrient uptake outer membrane protein n=1 Tax=Aggregatimonas sangjinii TaxID=2583587 RepID=A0A5B7SVN7_9FLAO|nr:RagB/SusD family nutrient uptake outer membrane protein [Aggregatimonas sangjinii]QCX01369.1 RagB/SusD family nutrient uptake outer membrane protein [Aggregatimonas sangjinii]
MKNCIKLIVLLVVFWGCEPLDEVPFSSLAVDNLYQDEADVDAALFGVYAALNNGNNDLWYFLYTSGPGESVVVRLKGDGNQGRASSLSFQAGDALGVWWPNFYRGINRANAVIANVSLAGLDAELEEQKIAEARFARAFFYFNLVKWFGGVPLQLEETTDFSDESIKKPRSSIEEVYTVIVEDLQYAETRLPDSWNAQNLGRATSGAAKGFLGKVYLNMAGKPLEMTGMYEQAADKLQEVVDSGAYALQDDFEQIFSIDNEFNSEIIFARPNIRETGSGTVLTFFAGVPNSPFANRNGQYQFGFTQNFYDSFDEDDLRRDATLLFTYTDAMGRSVTFNDPDNPPLPFGGYNDPKGIGFGKLKDGQNDVSPFAHENDLIFMRYADVLLMLAESLNESGDSAEALPYLNQVRDRAGLEDVDTTDQGELRDFIKQERKWELAGEYTEYPDLQRWGDIESSLENNEDAAVFGTVYSPTIELLPIPQSQIDANENLVQNPGY